MSSKDRAREIEKYSELFEGSASDEEVIASLGSPTRLAIAIARDYVPSEDDEEEYPAQDEVGSVPPAEDSGSEAEPAENAPPAEAAETQAEASDSAPAPAPDSAADEAPTAQPAEDGDTSPVFSGDSAMSPEMLSALEKAIEKRVIEEENEPYVQSEAESRKKRGRKAEKEAAKAAKREKKAEISEKADVISEEAPAGNNKKRRARPVAVVFYTIVSLLIGLPVAVVLIFIGVPILALGAGAVALTVWAAASIIPALAMISDILMVLGTSMIISAVGLILAWLGVFISLSLGSAWIGGVVFRLGSKLCFKEVSADE